MIDGIKPYPRMKDSGVPWLGAIPEHWDQLPGRACYREHKTPNTGLQETTVLSLSYGRLVIKPPDKLHGLVPTSFETYQIIDPGDIVIRPTDLQNDWNSLRFGLSQHRGVITSAYMCFRPLRVMTHKYGYILLHAYDLKKVFYGLGSGLRQNLDWSDFKYLPCLVPPRDEQAAIVRFLDHADRKIRRYIQVKQKLIKLLEEQKQAAIHQAVTGQIDVRTGLPYMAYKSADVEWLGYLPKTWSSTTVRRVISFITSGSRGWAQYYSDSGDLFIQSGNLGRAMALKTNQVTFVRPPQGAEGLMTIIRKHDVLVCVTGALTGNVAHVDSELPIAYVNQHVALIRPRVDAILPRFLAYTLHSEIGRLQFKMTEYGGTKQGLGLDDVRSVWIPLPSFAEQERIVHELDLELDRCREAVTAIDREIALIREFHIALVSDVVTGKLDVREAAARLPDVDEEPESTEEPEDTLDDANSLEEIELDEAMSEAGA